MNETSVCGWLLRRVHMRRSICVRVCVCEVCVWRGGEPAAALALRNSDRIISFGLFHTRQHMASHLRLMTSHLRLMTSASDAYTIYLNETHANSALCDLFSAQLAWVSFKYPSRGTHGPNTEGILRMLQPLVSDLLKLTRVIHLLEQYI